MMSMKNDKREEKILDAVFGEGCRSLQAISNTTGIPYNRVHYFFETRFGGAEALRRLRQKDDFEIAAGCYEKGMSLRKLMKATGIPEHRLRPFIKNVRKEERRIRRAANRRNRKARELRETHDSIMKSIDDHIHIRSMQEDPVYRHAVNLTQERRSYIPFEKLYARMQDIYAGRSIFECSDKWGITRTGVEAFISLIGLYDFYKRRHFERLVPQLEQKETAVLDAICISDCFSVPEISDATGISENEVNMIITNAGLKTELTKIKRQKNYQAVVEAYKDRVEERVKPSEIARVAGVTPSLAGIYMQRFRTELRKRRAREKHPEYFV
ncbi:hypothetical protein KY336_02880 [Candidatus Woesearchaeota archaeon]|nr:hypothetical protein [Candidatus Woesearchaeota archaeon]